MESVPGAIATGWYARLWRAGVDIDRFFQHARGVRTDPVAIAPGTDLRALTDVEKGKQMGKTSVQKVGKTKIKSRMKNLLMFLPNMVVLSAKLMVDSRVPRTERALFAGAVIYAIIPFDFIADMIPFIGQIDDLFLIALTLLRLIDRTDDVVVRENWRGGGDIVQLAESAATLAPLLMPKRVARVLISKVNPTSEGAGLLASAAKGQPVLVETPEHEKRPDRSKLADFGSRKRRSGSA